MRKRLITPPRHFNSGLVPDLLLVIMANVEDAMIASGAAPGVDYDRSDLLAAATPLVVTMLNGTGEPPAFITEWSDEEVSS